MRLVIIESPFIPQTPLLDLRCVHEMTCEQAAKIYNSDGVQTNSCANCRRVAEIKQLREKELARNARYLDAAMRDCFSKGEAPFASHGLYTRVTDDNKPEERRFGIQAGFAWREVAAATLFYVDLDWSGGMRMGEQDAVRVREMSLQNTVRWPEPHQIEIRRLGGDWSVK